MEDYLKIILCLKESGKVPRTKDISFFMGVTPPTVNSAMKCLKKHGLIKKETYGYIELTREGKNVADKFQAKHTVLKRFLENILGIESEIAGEDACKIAHTVSLQTYNKIVEFLDMVESYSEEEMPICLKYFRKNKFKDEKQHYE